jgi:hypothetical protein
MSTETLHLEYLDGKTIAVITLDDPAHANAISAEMGDAFSPNSARNSDAASPTPLIAPATRGVGTRDSRGGVGSDCHRKH